MADFALNVAVAYRVGTARSDRTILSGMDISADEFFVTFGKSINELILTHYPDLERRRKTTRLPSEPKMRWVDGTPEYSLHIYALRKLFPEALFIHIVRDVREVVRSMLNFHRVAGFQLVENEEGAYMYWLRTVKACRQAEAAFGPRVVKRLLYSALVDHPESAMHGLLDFVGESYSAKCLEPFKRRINSSDVPADFIAEDPATDPHVVNEATELYSELEKTSQPSESSLAAAADMQATFARRTHHMATVEKQLQEALRAIKSSKT